MDWNKLQKHLSTPRISRYLHESGQDQALALRRYRTNVELSEALFPALNAVEIALRNAVHAHLSEQFGRPDWWVAKNSIVGTRARPGAFFKSQEKINHAKSELRKRREATSPDKIVCELTFGFGPHYSTPRFSETSGAMAACIWFSHTALKTSGSGIRSLLRSTIFDS